MPELPEVETTRRQLEAKISNKKIKAIIPVQTTKITGPVETLVGQSIDSMIRIGKYLIFVLSDKRFVVTHLKMSGRMMIANESDELSKHLKIAILFADGMRLDFIDVRKFGFFAIVDRIEPIQEKLGIDPLCDYFTLSSFQDIVNKKRNSKLKPFLLDQSNVAGIGNIYADEVCFYAKLSPFEKLLSLKESDVSNLYVGIKEILKKAIALQGTSLGKGLTNFKTPHGETGQHEEGLMVYGLEGLPCKRCGDLIQKRTFASRGTHFCPSCQIEA